MEQTTETTTGRPDGLAEASAVLPSQETDVAVAPPPPCPTCGGASESQARSFIYALGRIEPRFPGLAVEKEYAQVVGRTDTKGFIDSEVRHAVLSKRENRYLARQMCWVFTIESLETYLLVPRDPVDLDLLIEAIRPVSSKDDVDIVIGVRGPIAPPEMCNGLMVPIVAFDQIYSFDQEALIKSIPKPEKVAAKDFGKTANELFDRIMQIADNAGASDDHRALNYCAVRYPAIYEKHSELSATSSLSALEVRPSRLSSSVRKVVDVIFAHTNRSNAVTEKHFVRVDVTDEFPYLVTPLSPYYDR